MVTDVSALLLKHFEWSRGWLDRTILDLDPSEKGSLVQARQEANLVRLSGSMDHWHQWALDMTDVAARLPRAGRQRELFEMLATFDLPDTVDLSDLTLSGRVYPGDLILSNLIASGDVYLNHVHVFGSVRLEHLDLPTRLLLEGSQCHGEILLNSSIVHAGIEGRKIVSNGAFLAKNLRCGGPCWFQASQFLQSVVFDGAEFLQDAGFGSVRFKGPCSFRGVRFGGQAGFERADWARQADFSRALFEDVFWLNHARFAIDPQLDLARFRAPVRAVGLDAPGMRDASAPLGERLRSHGKG